MSKQLVSFKVNGKQHDAIVEPQMTLIEVLRDQFGLTGTKHGCSIGLCGACTVLIDGTPILACMTLALTVKDKDVITIEGLAKSDHLHPVQRAFIDHGAIQCGYCTPGMILSAKALLDKIPDPTRKEVAVALSGNLCRCTGYVKIVDAVLDAAKTMGKGDQQL